MARSPSFILSGAFPAAPSDRPHPRRRARSPFGFLVSLIWIFSVVAASPLPAGAEIATLDLLFDLDQDELTGCDVITADGTALGVDLRLRSLVDTELASVTSSTHADCAGGTFGPETTLPPSLPSLLPPGSPAGSPGLPAAPWPTVPGNGASGATLIETHLPLVLASPPPGAQTNARLHVALSSASGDDALHLNGQSGPILVPLAPPAVPTLGAVMLFGAALLSGLVGAWQLNRRNPALGRFALFFVVGGAVGVALLASPASVQALLGEGTGLLRWPAGTEIAADPAGDATATLDLTNVYAALDPDAGELWLRADAFFGPPICLDWGAVDPGTGYQCTQQPALDQGPFGLQVAMTFDDGPSTTITPGVVAILRAENIPATFFMRGDRLQTATQRAIALDIYQDPLFRIANHTYNHPRIPTLTPAEVQTQIEDTSAALREAIGDPCFYPEYFRFPFNASDCTTMEIVRENGHAVAGINIDAVDWCYASGGGTCTEARAPWMAEIWRDDMPGYVVNRLQISSGGIMLMHDIHQNTLDELPAVIAALRAAGATFVDLDDPTLFPILNANINQPEAPACCDGQTSN